MVRCAIYTRVSTENELDQEFNSLDAQHEASSAYIKSQAHAGWSQVRTRYDDGGYSGGSTERPALLKLMDDVRARKVDVIVVYKVDRLTRSLADFAKLVELFDEHSISFVSVTQQFNTTTSMGRLTLNVLLSFAQFEREVTSERIRDKIAASKKKGIWVGGPLPLGYEMKDGKISIVEDEAERVRSIFRRYLELGAIHPLLYDLRQRNVLTKRRLLKSGAVRGGVPFCKGGLSYLLRNCFYVGEVSYKGQTYPGEQPPIMDRSLFDAVQQRLADQWAHHTRTRSKFSFLLTGLVFDDAGHRMAPTQAKKNGINCRYYVSRPLLFGHAATAQVGSIARVPAAEIETLVSKSVLEPNLRGNQSRPLDNEYARSQIERIEFQQDQLVVVLKQEPAVGAEPAEATSPIVIPWQKSASKKPRAILMPRSAPAKVRPIKLERRATLVAAIARGRRWLDELVAGRATGVEEIAIRSKRSARHVSMTISLAFLSPSLVRAAIEGRLPRGIGVEQLRELPPGWDDQFRSLGLSPE
jgi:DNA invertase Pin-like site-specific DNA recombinase